MLTAAPKKSACLAVKCSFQFVVTVRLTTTLCSVDRGFMSG